MSTISSSTTSTTAYKVTADTTGVLTLQTGATPTTAVTIDGSQNVGIGTVSPSNTLHVVGSQLLTSASAETKFNITNTGTGGVQYWIGSTNNSSGAVGGGRLAFYDQTSNAARMVIDSNGNVGIGTTSPSTKLQVNGTVGVVGGNVNLDSGQYVGFSGASTALISRNSGADIALYANSADRVYVQGSTGNVGIGTTSPTTALQLGDGTGTANDKTIRLWSGYPTGNAGVTGTLLFSSNVSGGNQESVAAIKGQMGLASNTNSLAFYVGDWNNSATLPATPYMVINSTGYVLVGATTTSNSAKFYAVNSSGTAGGFYNSAASQQGTPALRVDKADNTSTTSQVFVQFLINAQATGSGQINANGANAAAFGSYSDRRLKENIVDLPPQLASIMALRPVEYDYIESEGGGHQIGFIAQEVQEVYPDLIGEREDGMFTLSDMNKNDARLIKAIQEQQALITALTARITALEAK